MASAMTMSAFREQSAYWLVDNLPSPSVAALLSPADPLACNRASSMADELRITRRRASQPKHDDRNGRLLASFRFGQVLRSRAKFG
eukprot:4472777-Prymnesium_polylepis.6